MSGIRALRLTNIKYNEQNFVMDDLFLEFHNDTDLVHGLTTMPNGYGKGVILQLMFQIFKPLKEWQGGKGRVTQFFHGPNGVFRPYTLYSALEWKLDGTEERYLITGIAITARKIKEADRDKPKTDTPYKLFTILCDPMSDHRLSKLPYWEVEEGEAWPLERWEEYAREFPQQIRLYGKDELRKYRSALQDYGIFTDEWDEMFKINQNEAGTTVRFENEGVGYNDGLFRNVIIPSVDSNLRKQHVREGYQDLKELFIEVAKIAYNLNTLLARKGAMNGILSLLDEAQTVYTAQEQAERRLNAHFQKGVEIKSALSEWMTQADRDLKTVLKEHADAESELREFRFQLKNLSYIEAQYKLRDLQKKFVEVCSAIDKELAVATEQKRLAESVELDILRKEYETISKLLQDTLSELTSLMEREKIADVKKEQRKMALEIEREWQTLLSHARIAVQEALGYQFVLQSNIENMQKEYEETQLNRQELNRKIGDIEGQVRAFGRKRKEMEDTYGVTDTFTLTRLIDELHDEMKQLIESEQREQEAADEAATEFSAFERQQGKMEAEIEQDEKTIQRITEAYEKQARLEAEAAAGIQPYVGLELPWNPEAYPVWILEHLPDVASELERRRGILKREEDDLRRLETESMMTDSGVWVPNETIMQLRDTIKSHGFTCQLGTEYIDQRDDDARAMLQQTAKLLPYGLVILESERERILRLTNYKKRVLFNPVPLFSTEQMDDMSPPSFVTMPNRGDEIGFSSVALEVYLRESAEEIQRRNAQLAEGKRQLQTMKRAVVIAQSIAECEITAEQLNEELTALEESYEQKKHEVEEIAARIENLRGIKQSAQSRARQFAQQANVAEQKQHTLKQLEQEWVIYRKNEEELEMLQKKDEEAVLYIQQVEQTKREVAEELDEQKNTYGEWRRSLEWELRKFKEAVPHLPLIGDVPPIAQLFAPELWPTIPSCLQANLNRWNACRQTLEQANIQIARLEERKAQYTKQQEDRRSELAGKDSRWAELKAPQDSLEVLKQRRNRHLQAYEEADVRRQATAEQAASLRGAENEIISQAEKLRTDIEKEFEPREVEYRSGINVEEKRKEFEWRLQNVAEKHQQAKQEVDKIAAKKRILAEANERLQQVAENGQRAPRKIYDAVGADAKAVVGAWNQMYLEVERELSRIEKSCMQQMHDIQRKIKQSPWDEEMRRHGDELFDNLRSLDSAEMVLGKIVEAKGVYKGILEREEVNLAQAQEAELRWVQTATEYSRIIISHIGEMIKGMAIRNRYNYLFPLLKLKNETVLSVQDIESRMEGLFRQTLQYIETKGIDIHAMQKNDLGQRLDAGTIVHAAYNYVFPTMQVYNMNIENAFWVDRPSEKYYKDWEVFLQGSGEVATGSGGQRLAAFTLLAIMLTTQKRRRNKILKRSVLINDNPFANAVSPHVLDPIFRVADSLGVQWIVLAPPELVNKIEVSERFPAYYGLDLEADGTGKHKVIVSSRHIRNTSKGEENW